MHVSLTRFLGAFLLTLLIYSCGNRHPLMKGAGFNENFSKEHIAMILDEEKNQPMRVWKISLKEDSLLLRKNSSEINDFKDPILDHFINRLHATVRDSINDGVGIAAPQVGVLKQIIWVQRFDKKDYPFEVYINPEIAFYSEQKQPCREGCLSIPNRSDTLNVRSEEIEINYLTREGEPKTERIKGFTAVIFQHEIDHLNGILYTDYLEDE